METTIKEMRMNMVKFKGKIKKLLKKEINPLRKFFDCFQNM